MIAQPDFFQKYGSISSIKVSTIIFETRPHDEHIAKKIFVLEAPGKKTSRSPIWSGVFSIPKLIFSQK